MSVLFSNGSASVAPRTRFHTGKGVPGVVVLGMHRSGTSLITSILREMGFHVGEEEELLPATTSNAAGFQEREDVVAINEWLLRSTSSLATPLPAWTGWLHGRPLTPEDLTPAQQVHFRSRAEGIVARLEQEGSPWVLKDPRLCLTFPVWKPLLGGCHVVLIWRDPVQVAKSLRARDRLPFSLGLALWEQYNRHAVHSSAGCSRSVIPCRELFAGPEAVRTVLRRLCAQNDWSPPCELTEESLAAILRPDLIHQRESSAESDDYLPRDLRTLKNAMEHDAPIETALSAFSQMALEDFRHHSQCLLTARSEAAALDRQRQVAREAIAKELAATRMLQELNLEFQAGVKDLLASRRWKIAHVLFNQWDRLRPKPVPRPLDALAHAQRKCADCPKPAAGRVIPVHRQASVVAIVSAYNEARFIPVCLHHLAEHGIQAVLIDNESTDETVRLASAFLGKGLLRIETLPRGEVFDWTSVLQAKTDIQDRLDCDWMINWDPDELRVPCQRGKTLQQAIRDVDRDGFNAINFHELTFVPCQESPEHDHPDFLRTMRWYYPFRTREIRRLDCWKKQAHPVDLVPSGGHLVAFDGCLRYPDSFFMRHYLFLSLAHAAEKYGGRRYARDEVAKGWHTWRSDFEPSHVNLPAARDLSFYVSDDTLSPHNPREEHILA